MTRSSALIARPWLQKESTTIVPTITTIIVSFSIDEFRENCSTASFASARLENERSRVTDYLASLFFPLYSIYARFLIKIAKVLFQVSDRARVGSLFVSVVIVVELSLSLSLPRSSFVRAERKKEGKNGWMDGWKNRFD